jgi:hypothetical protein
MKRYKFVSRRHLRLSLIGVISLPLILSFQNCSKSSPGSVGGAGISIVDMPIISITSPNSCVEGHFVDGAINPNCAADPIGAALDQANEEIRNVANISAPEIEIDENNLVSPPMESVPAIVLPPKAAEIDPSIVDDVVPPQNVVNNPEVIESAPVATLDPSKLAPVSTSNSNDKKDENNNAVPIYLAPVPIVAEESAPIYVSPELVPENVTVVQVKEEEREEATKKIEEQEAKAEAERKAKEEEELKIAEQRAIKAKEEEEAKIAKAKDEEEKAAKARQEEEEQARQIGLERARQEVAAAEETARKAAEEALKAAAEKKAAEEAAARLAEEKARKEKEVEEAKIAKAKQDEEDRENEIKKQKEVVIVKVEDMPIASAVKAGLVEAPPAPEKRVCQPFTSPAAKATVKKTTLGVMGELFYSNTTSISKFNDLVTKGRKSEASLYFDNLFVPTVPFSRGFVSDNGQPLKTADGKVLIEYFGVRAKGQLQVATEEDAGIYQLAILSDDGSNLKIMDPKTKSMTTIINNDGNHPTKMGCTSQTIALQPGQKIPFELEYYQGPRYHIAMALVWRKVVPGMNMNEPLCGKSGNDTFWDSSKTPSVAKGWAELQRRGWKPIEASELVMPERQVNPCNESK